MARGTTFIDFICIHIKSTLVRWYRFSPTRFSRVALEAGSVWEVIGFYSQESYSLNTSVKHTSLHQCFRHIAMFHTISKIQGNCQPLFEPTNSLTE
jgi:hypothetical protein